RPSYFVFFFQAEDGIRDFHVTGVQTCALPISYIGIVSLASSEDRQAAMLRGIDVKWLALGAFVVAGALVAAVAPVIAAKTYATYHLGDILAVKAFVALAIGGFGSYAGVLIGGFVVGLLEAFSARYI